MERWLSTRMGYGLLAALYVLSFPYHPKLRSPNELCRLWQSRAIVDHHTLILNQTMQEAGGVGDLSCAGVFDVGGKQVLAPCVQPPEGSRLVEARYYPSKAPLLSFLGVPVYWLLERVGPVTELGQVYFSRLFITVLPTLLMLVLLRRFLLALVAPWADVLTAVYGLGTMAFAYSEQFLSHQLTAALLFATFYCAWRVETKAWRERGYLLAGLLGGAAVMAEYTAALTVVCVAVYVVASRWKKWGALSRPVALVVAGAAPMLLGLMAYHQSCYGHPLESGYRWLNDPGYQHWHVGGFLGIKWPQPLALVLSFFSPLRGLFALSPFLLLAFWGLKGLKLLDRAQLVFVSVLLGANAYFTSSFDYTSWGWTVGPRHLVPLVPFLMLPVGLALERLKEQGVAFSLAAGLCVSSVAATGIVSFVNYVPDDLSTSLFGLAVPVLASGRWPVSVLAAVVPNPASGALLVILLIAVCAWLVLRFRAQRALPAFMLVAAVLHFGLLRLATKGDNHDVGGQTFLHEVWVAPDGVRLQFFP